MNLQAPLTADPNRAATLVLPGIAAGLALLCCACGENSEKSASLTEPNPATENQAASRPQTAEAAQREPAWTAEGESTAAQPASDPAQTEAAEPGTAGSSSSSLRPLTGFAAKVAPGAEAYLGLYKLGEIWQGMTRSAFWSEVTQLFETFPQALAATAMEAKTTSLIQSLLSREVGVILGEGSSESLRRLVEIGYLNDVAGIKTLGREFHSGSSLRKLDTTAEAPPILGEMDRLLPLLNGFRLPPITFLFRVEDAPHLLATHQPAHPPKEMDMTVSSFPGPGGFPFTRIETTLGRQAERIGTEALEQALGEETTRQFLEIAARITGTLCYGALDSSTVAIHLGPDAAGLEKLLQAAESSLANSDRLAFIDPLLDSEILSLNWTSGTLLDATRGHHPASALLQASLDSLEEHKSLEKVADKLRPDLEGLMARGEASHQHPATDQVGIGWRTGTAFRYEGKGGLPRPGMLLEGTSRFLLPEKEASVFSATWVANLEERRAAWKYFRDLTFTLASGTRILLEEVGTQVITESSQGPLGILLGMSTLLGPTISEIHHGLHSLYNEALGDESLLTIDLGGTLDLSRDNHGQLTLQRPIPRITLAHSLRDRNQVDQAWKQIAPALNNLLLLIPVPGTPLRLPKPLKQVNDAITTWSYPLPAVAGNTLPTAVLGEDLLVLTTCDRNDAGGNHPLGDFFNPENSDTDAMEAGAGFRLSLNLPPLSRAAATWLRLARDKQARLGTRATIPIDPETLDTALQIAGLSEAIGRIRLRIHREAPGAEPQTSLLWNYQDILKTN